MLVNDACLSISKLVVDDMDMTEDDVSLSIVGIAENDADSVEYALKYEVSISLVTPVSYVMELGIVSDVGEVTIRSSVADACGLDRSYGEDTEIICTTDVVCGVLYT